MVYAVFADAGEAARIGRAMVGQRLAACVNILAPCRSIYRWEGAIETADEVPVAADRADTLIAAIVAAHSYAVPAIVAWDVATAHPPYADWVRSA